VLGRPSANVTTQPFDSLQGAIAKSIKSKILIFIRIAIALLLERRLLPLLPAVSSFSFIIFTQLLTYSFIFSSLYTSFLFIVLHTPTHPHAHVHEHNNNNSALWE